MKLTNGEIFNAQEPLKKLLAEKLPVKDSFKLARLAQKLDDQLLAINQTRQGLFKTYGDLDTAQQKYIVKPYIDDGSGKAIENPNVVKFQEEMRELMAIEMEIVFDKVNLPNTLEIEPRDLIVLEKFVKSN